ncbi:hypothetical protein [Tenacibaculum ovolyticum]|uniref:hypothetical protein n=1 Tax=Tenacibaculum ovolyticum TaxID=104270 RepID=UPI0003FA8CBF|nr:hypothetical protein [Tenacibaculum ovolyticum]
MSVIQEFKNNICSALFLGATNSLESQLLLLQNKLDSCESSNIIDKIDPNSKAKLEELKKRVKQKINTLITQIEKSKGTEKKDLKIRIKELEEALEEIKVIEHSQSTYEFRIGNKPKFSYENISDKGLVFYDGTLGSLLNELKHVFQFETGKIDFIKVSGEPENLPGLLYDLGDEVETYKRQYAYDGVLKLRVVMTDEEVLNQFKSGKIKNGLGLGTLEIKKMKKITADVIVKVEDSLGSGSLYSAISKRSLDIHSSLGNIRKGNKHRSNFITGLGIDKRDKNEPYIDFIKVFIENNPFIYVKY